jgi:hypothetical protein
VGYVVREREKTEETVMKNTINIVQSLAIIAICATISVVGGGLVAFFTFC